MISDLVATVLIVQDEGCIKDDDNDMYNFKN